MFLKRYLALAVATLILAFGSAAMAAEIVVTQTGKKFDKKSVTINEGDAIKFVNADKVTHNIFSKSAGSTFDSGAQKPGTSSSVTFEKSGKFKARCAIHPKMKLKITVK